MNAPLYEKSTEGPYTMQVDDYRTGGVDFAFAGRYVNLDRAAVQRVATWLAEWLRETAP